MAAEIRKWCTGRGIHFVFNLFDTLTVSFLSTKPSLSTEEGGARQRHPVAAFPSGYIMRWVVDPVTGNRKKRLRCSLGEEIMTMYEELINFNWKN